jgi:hypothetical protein
MALSQSVESSLREAESHLRNALAFAARQESPYVSCAISNMIAQIDSIIKTDKLFDNIDSMIEKRKNDF